MERCPFTRLLINSWNGSVILVQILFSCVCVCAGIIDSVLCTAVFSTAILRTAFREVVVKSYPPQTHLQHHGSIVLGGFEDPLEWIPNYADRYSPLGQPVYVFAVRGCVCVYVRTRDFIFAQNVPWTFVDGV